MHGRTTTAEPPSVRRPSARYLALLLAVLAGCGEVPALKPEPADGPSPAASSAFDPDSAGTLRGQVVWAGPRPSPAAFLNRLDPALPFGEAEARLRQNPNFPSLDAASCGVADAIIFLRDPDRRRARRWDHPPVRVEMQDYKLTVVQGPARSRAGFVRQGDAVELMSRQPVPHSLRARGPAYFTLAFPDPDQPLQRRFDRRGVVELTSGNGYFWMRGYLFVDDHPYYTRTDAAGHYILPQVPPGRYEVVCWHPSWHTGRTEHDSDTGLVRRLHFKPPAARVRSVELAPGELRDVDFELSAADFSAK